MHSVEVRVAEVLKKVADSLAECLKVKLDYPAKHQRGRVPILDVEALVEEVEEELDGMSEKLRWSTLAFI